MQTAFVAVYTIFEKKKNTCMVYFIGKNSETSLSIRITSAHFTEFLNSLHAGIFVCDFVY